MSDYSYLNKLTCYCDLHYHLDGSLSLENVKQLARISKIELPKDDKEIRKLFQCDPNWNSLEEFLSLFGFTCSLLQTKECLTLATQNILKELQKDGCIYAEIRFAPQLHCQKGLSQEDAVLAVLEGCKNSPIYTNIILCMMRGTPEQSFDKNMETLLLAKKYLGKGVVAIDLAGAEKPYPTITFKELFDKANELGIPFTIHAGEADSSKSVKDAISFGAKRIGHGVRSVEDESLIDEIYQKKVTLEVCPTSNILTGIYKEYEEIPIKILLDKGIQITINTDDKAIIGCDIKSEFINIAKSQNLSKSQIKLLLLNSISASYASDNIKNIVINNINSQL